MKLIIINGLPGSGKSTLATPLSKELGLPLIAKDTIKEFLFDQLGARDRAWSRALGKASNDFLYSLVETMLCDGQSLIIENAFEKTFAIPRLRQIIEKYHPQTVEIYCTADSEIRKQRFIDRNESGERHPGHVDQENYAANSGSDFSAKYTPIEISEVIHVDTTNYVDITVLANSINNVSEF
jgi:predicted kinase